MRLSRLFSLKSASRLESNAERPCSSNLLFAQVIAQVCPSICWSAFQNGGPVTLFIILTFEGNGTMFRGISSVGTCKTICFYVLFILRPEKYTFSKFRKYSRQGTWLARTWQLHSQCLLTAMRRPRSSSAQNRLTCRASVSKDVDWSPQMKKKKCVNSALNITVSLHLSAPAAGEAKSKTVVTRSGYYKKLSFIIITATIIINL